jgi:uncharacterized RDD family membrane protein YckC
MVIFCSLSWLLLLPLAHGLDLGSGRLDLDLLITKVSLPTWRSHAAGVVGIWIGLWWAYFALGWGLAGATPGRWLMGIAIVDHRERCPIGVSRALLRLVAYCVSSVTLGWGHLLILTRRDRRALHDLLAGTRVVVRRGHRRVDGVQPHPHPDPDPDPEQGYDPGSGRVTE